jgi:hypothetical protein
MRTRLGGQGRGAGVHGGEPVEWLLCTRKRKMSREATVKKFNDGGGLGGAPA